MAKKTKLHSFYCVVKAFGTVNVNAEDIKDAHRLATEKIEDAVIQAGMDGPEVEVMEVVPNEKEV